MDYLGALIIYLAQLGHAMPLTTRDVTKRRDGVLKSFKFCVVICGWSLMVVQKITNEQDKEKL